MRERFHDWLVKKVAIPGKIKQSQFTIAMIPVSRRISSRGFMEFDVRSYKIISAWHWITFWRAVLWCYAHSFWIGVHLISSFNDLVECFISIRVFCCCDFSTYTEFEVHTDGFNFWKWHIFTNLPNRDPCCGDLGTSCNF